MTTYDTDPSIEDEVSALRAELAELRQRVDAAATPVAAPTRTVEAGELVPVDAVHDRRQLLRRAGVAAAATVAGGAALAMTQASPAAAANGNSIVIGNNGASIGNNTGTATTELRSTNNTNTMGLFVVQDGTVTLTLFPAAIQGLATNGAVAHGVYGFTDQTNGTGVVGVGQSAGVFASGAEADLRLGGLGTEPNQATPSRAAMNFTAADNLWFCTSNAANSWVKLAGPATAGSLHMLPAPKRVYDSRPGTTPANPNKTKWQNNDERSIDAKFNSSTVPVGARAVMINATATNTNPGGFFSFFKSLPWPGTSSLNWGVANTTVATTTVVALDATASFMATMKGVGGADLIIDVVGYYQ